MMFCTACGAKVKDTFNYCSSCGTKIGDLRKKTEYQKRNNAANEGTSQDHVSNVGAKRQPLPTFAQYTKAKSVERQSHFKPTKRSKPNIHEVTLNVGIMEYVGSELRWSNTKNIIFLSLMLSDCSFTMLLCELP